ncbi:MAG: glycosyltransferase family 87 protein [Ginsengibacter sp.]
MNIINFIRELWHQPYFACLLAVASCLCFYFLRSKNKASGKFIWFVYSSILITTFFIFLGNGIYRIYHPQVWDFTAFYLFGKVAASGYNFYLPANFQIVFASLPLPLLDYSGLIQVAVNVGFPYPPTTILLFAPLGFLSYQTAMICWTTFLILLAIGCVYLIYDLFLKKYKLNGLMLAAILFFLLLPVQSTISFSQTNFYLLFFLLLMKKYSNKNFAGIFLALALLAKPYIIVFALIFILRKRWKAMIYFIVSFLSLIGLTVLFFGIGPFITYINDNPANHFPKWVFSEDVNQSLNAVLLRAHFISIDNSITYVYIVFSAFLVTAFYLFYLIRSNLYEHIWAVILLVALLLYPGTLSHYGVLLLFIIFQFFNEKNELGFNRYVNIPIIGIFYYLSSVSLFACICFLLIVLISKSLWPFSPGKLIHPKLYKDAM